MSDNTRVPPLGGRGEGWVVLQFALLGAIIVAGWRGHGDSSSTVAVFMVVAGIIILCLGMFLIAAGASRLSSSLSAMPRPRPTASFVRSGIYHFIRHPIYSGLMLVAAGWSIAWDLLIALILTAVLVVVLDLKARREEVWLAEQYPEYSEYARHTRRFVPFLY